MGRLEWPVLCVLVATACGGQTDTSGSQPRLATTDCDIHADRASCEAEPACAWQSDPCAGVPLPACPPACADDAFSRCGEACSPEGAACGNEIGDGMTCADGRWQCEVHPPLGMDCNLVCRRGPAAPERCVSATPGEPMLGCACMQPSGAPAGHEICAQPEGSRALEGIVCATLRARCLGQSPGDPCTCIGDGGCRASAEVGGLCVCAPATSRCRPTGCSSQLCSDQPLGSTCEWSEAYACYRTATCERQAYGRCDWTPTAELTACLARGGP